MSKKSRKRNKKILGALAAGLGAMALMKGRKRASIAGMDDAGIGVTHPALAKELITKKAVLPEPKVVVPPVSGGGGIHAGKPKTLYLEKRARAHLPKGPPGWDNPYRAPRVHSIRGMKKGGSVTGAAKRGFGRALMKGKK